MRTQRTSRRQALYGYAAKVVGTRAGEEIEWPGRHMRVMDAYTGADSASSTPPRARRPARASR